MNRRAFLSCAAGAVPALQSFAAQPSAEPGKARLVRAGQSADGETWQLGDRSFLHLKLSCEDSERAPLIVEQSQLRRFGPPRHLHFQQDEWFYPLAGTFHIEVGTERFELRPGDFLFAPRNVPHVWMHIEDEPGGMLVGFEPAGKMLAFFRRFTAGGALPSPGELPALFREHGMQIVGPPLAG
jgi:mannose-6-phosphate isomerase-like protein (cupin superfamily)